MNTGTPIRLASYNIRKCVGLDRRRKPGRIIDVINSLDADIVALQEADRRLGDRPAALPAQMIEENSDFRVVSQIHDGASIGWHGNAVLVRKGVAVSELNHIDLPGTEPRGAVALTIDGDIRVLATHLGLRRSDRRRQATAIARFLQGAKIPTMVMGDFNEWSPGRGLEAFNEDFTILAPGRSFHAARPIAALDRMALSGGIDLRDAGVVETKLSKRASDHLPIWADVNFRPQGRRGD